MPFIIIGVIILAIIIVRLIRIVPQAHSFVIERLGQYQATWDAGLHIKMPFIDRIAKKVSIKEQVVDFPPQPVITKDNVTMQIDTVVYFQITDPKLYCYGVENPILAIENLTATTLRNIVGTLSLDESLTSRETINTKMREVIDEATDPWGIKIIRIELKSIQPPAEIQNAMEKQMKAEREKRESILRAEGKRQAAITEAEGEKEARILKAQADKEARILDAEAVKEAEIKEAEGKALALLKMQEAEAKALKFLNEANIQPEVLKYKSFATLEKVADGQATKIIIPSDIQDTSKEYTIFQELALDKKDIN